MPWIRHHEISHRGARIWPRGAGAKRSLALVKQYARMLQQEPLLTRIAALLGRSGAGAAQRGQDAASGA